MRFVLNIHLTCTHSCHTSMRDGFQQIVSHIGFQPYLIGIISWVFLKRHRHAQCEKLLAEITGRCIRPYKLWKSPFRCDKLSVTNMLDIGGVSKLCAYHLLQLTSPITPQGVITPQPTNGLWMSTDIRRVMRHGDRLRNERGIPPCQLVNHPVLVKQKHSKQTRVKQHRKRNPIWTVTQPIIEFLIKQTLYWQG